MGLEWVFLLAYFFFSNQQSWLLILEDILCGGSMVSSSDLKTLQILSVCIYMVCKGNSMTSRSMQQTVQTWLWCSPSGFCLASSSCFCGLSTVLVGPEHGHGWGKMFVLVAHWVGQAVSLCIL